MARFVRAKGETQKVGLRALKRVLETPCTPVSLASRDYARRDLGGGYNLDPGSVSTVVYTWSSNCSRQLTELHKELCGDPEFRSGLKTSRTWTPIAGPSWVIRSSPASRS
jgi:hypothetical protein